MARFDVDTGWDTEFLTGFLAETLASQHELGSPDNTRFLMDPVAPGPGQYNHEKCTTHFTVLQYNVNTGMTLAIRMMAHAHNTTNVYSLGILTASGNHLNDRDLGNFATQYQIYVPDLIWRLMTNMVHTNHHLTEYPPNNITPIMTDDDYLAPRIAAYASEGM